MNTLSLQVIYPGNSIWRLSYGFRDWIFILILAFTPALLSQLLISDTARADSSYPDSPFDLQMNSGELKQQANIPFNNVFVVVGENDSRKAIIGNSYAPFMNSLAAQYASSASYYANTHPSIGNYFELTTGQVITNNDNYTGTVSADNIVRHLVSVRYTWKCYAESIPSAGYLGGNTGLYVKHHNPFAYLTDITKNKTEATKIVPFTQLATDIKNGTLPQYGFIVPNVVDDGHSCPASNPTCSANQKIADYDKWLKAKLMPLIADKTFSATGLLVITFDEGSRTDHLHRGGQVAWIAVAASAKPGYVGTSPSDQHQNTLRLMGTSLGLTSLPGAANSGDNMSSYFN